MFATVVSAPHRTRGVLLTVSALALWLALAPTALAADADALARDASSSVRKARNHFFAGKFQEALDEAAKADKLVEELKAANSRHRSLRRLESDLKRVKADAQKRMGASTPATGTGGKPAPAGDKLPSAVASRVKTANRWVDLGRLDRAKGDLDAIEARYAGKFPKDHPEIVALKARMASLKAKQDAVAKGEADAEKKAVEAKARVKAQSDTWLAKLNVYVEGYDTANSRANPKHLVAKRTSDTAELKRLKTLFDEATVLFAEYKKVAFPDGKAFELDRAEKTLAKTLTEFPEAYRQSLADLSAGPEEALKQMATHFARDTAWRTDPKKMPYSYPKSRVDDIAKAVAKAAASLPAGDAKAAAMKKQLAALVQENAARRQVYVERTFMRPDRFTGKELDAIKAKAVAILGKKVPDARVLRTTVISKDWTKEEVIEYEDVEKTKPVRKVRRGVTAQIAAKQGADVFLYAVHVGQQEQLDGAWGPLYGNLHQSPDRMLEKNVQRDAP
ncbi:hypothetical protein HQ560_03405 [bacterium]|nr:hypothetical protein [bacterium]